MNIFSRGDIEIRYNVYGTGEQVVVLLHGFPDSSAVWKYQIPVLKEHGFKVVVPDLRGFGESSKPDEVASYKISELRQDVIALLDTLSVDRCYVVGHDWGAALSWNIAMSNPERVIKLAVLSNGHVGAFFTKGGLIQRQKSWYMLLFNTPDAEEIISANDFALWRIACQHEKPEIVDGRIEELSKPGVLTGGLMWYKAIAPPKMFAKTEAPQLPKVNLPVLGIWASRDIFLTKEQMTGSEEYVESGLFEFKELPDVGHWMQLEAPEKVNQALLEFLRKPQVPHSSL